MLDYMRSIHLKLHISTVKQNLVIVSNQSAINIKHRSIFETDHQIWAILAKLNIF